MAVLQAWDRKLADGRYKCPHCGRFEFRLSRPTMCFLLTLFSDSMRRDSRSNNVRGDPRRDLMRPAPLVTRPHPEALEGSTLTSSTRSTYGARQRVSPRAGIASREYGERLLRGMHSNTRFGDLFRTNKILRISMDSPHQFIKLFRSPIRSSSRVPEFELTLWSTQIVSVVSVTVRRPTASAASLKSSNGPSNPKSV
jgi:hypothetical protein